MPVTEIGEHRPRRLGGGGQREIVAIRNVCGQDHGLEKTLDVTTLVPMCKDALEHKKPVKLELPIRKHSDMWKQPLDVFGQPDEWDGEPSPSE